jgi:hypothetical protein
MVDDRNSLFLRCLYDIYQDTEKMMGGVLMYVFNSINEADERFTISGTHLSTLLSTCLAAADCISLQRGMWKNATDSTLEEALKPYLLEEFHTKQWFGYDLRNAPPEDAWEMNILIYSNPPEVKTILLSHITDIFLGYASQEPYMETSTLEDICFLKKNKIILGTVSHELMAHAYPPDEQFKDSILGTGNWIEAQYDDPQLILP